jgi:hypothetical protein
MSVPAFTIPVLGQLPPTSPGVDPNGAVQTTGGDTAGLIVLAVVMLIIIGGATILWLRHRRPRP